MKYIIVVFMLFMVLADLYIWRMFIRRTDSRILKILWWLPAAVSLATAAAWLSGIYTDWLMRTFCVILFCLVFPKLLFILFSIVGAVAGTVSPALRKILNTAGLAAAVIMCGCAVYGLTRGIRRLEVREVTAAFPNLPQAFDGYRIVHISDLHVGTYGNDNSFLERLVERANSLQADIILFTGDLINVSPAETEPHSVVLSQLKARDGVWSVTGNHDYCEYARYDRPDGAEIASARLIELEKQAGWHLLLNEHTVIRRGGDSIAIAGVENISLPPFPTRGDLAKATEGIAEGMFTVLLTHDPSHWRREVLPAAAADLTLSGHTHAMQFEIFGFSPSVWTYPEWGGLYREGSRALYVSKGAGGTAPFRFGAWPEITVLTLVCEIRN